MEIKNFWLELMDLPTTRSNKLGLLLLFNRDTCKRNISIVDIIFFTIMIILFITIILYIFIELKWKRKQKGGLSK